MKTFLPLLFSALTPAYAATCDSLGSLALPDTKVTLAQPVAPGDFAPPGGRAGGPSNAGLFKNLPAFCRVAATLKPTSDSDIKIEVWLPAAAWNGKFQAVGNGGWAGVISYSAMAQALEHGYATASTDTGHVGPSGSFVVGHPEKLIDFGYRSEHEMTVKAKDIIQAFYGDAPKVSYWNGCSTGGRQGLKEAQRFPDDYDAIIAGAPANPRTRLAFATLWIAQAAHKDEASNIPAAKYPMIHQAVLNACDALDGLKDGLLTDPTLCHFDPQVLACKDADGPSCLTAPQIETVRKILSPPKNPRTGEEIYPTLEPGTELGWATLAGPQPFQATVDHFKYVVFKDPDWDWKTLNFDSDVALADKIDNETINATDPNLRPFFSHKGKLLLYHGFSDQNVPPRSTINYYKRVVDTVGGAGLGGAGLRPADSIRLFMVPGMGHCGGGEGPNTFDMLSAVEQWKEQGKKPARIVASHRTAGKVDRTRPLCAYPQVAKYKGAGSIDDEANFTCELPSSSAITR
ncbi:MAG TPA: tannase/feruloyl esterase family alpha/beta hydrolase, partial [Bryobacteraceae bacterium]|nr:tannase/feruloyl esterase family alpha/beta hydrolase [Bryobacteraceae bacterium]